MSQKLSRTEKKKEENHRLLLEAGRVLFSKNGVERTKISDLTDYADMGFGTFYLYFDSKYDLLKSLADEISEKLVEYKSVRKIKNLTIRERMFYGTYDMLLFITENEEIFRAILLSAKESVECEKIANSIWSKINERMFRDHMYFAKRGYAKKELTIGSSAWMTFNWSLKGIIEGLLSHPEAKSGIKEISKIYADMNYFTFISEEMQSKEANM